MAKRTKSGWAPTPDLSGCKGPVDWRAMEAAAGAENARRIEQEDAVHDRMIAEREAFDPMVQMARHMNRLETVLREHAVALVELKGEIELLKQAQDDRPKPGKKGWLR